MKSNKGITLIALVITIIVLIILAGVAINLTLGENGILRKSEEAKLKYEIAQAEEELDLKIVDLQAEKQGTATLQDLVDVLKNEEDMDYIVSLEEIASITGVETIGDVDEIYVVYKIYQFRVDDKLQTEFISIVENYAADVQISSTLKSHDGKNEDEKYLATFEIKVEGERQVQSIEIETIDGKVTETPTSLPYTKEIQVEIGQKYIVKVTTPDGKYKRYVIEEKAEETIKTAQELAAFRDKVNSGLTYEGKTVKLANDIDLSRVCYKLDGTTTNDVSWEPIGTEQTPFKGIFNGNYKKICNMYINHKSKSGVFDYIDTTAIIKSIIIDKSIIVANEEQSYVAFLVKTNKGTVSQCKVNNNSTVLINTNYMHVGGIASINQGNVEKCVNNADITVNSINGNVYIGGIAAVNKGNISASYNTGELEGFTSAHSGVGGINGENQRGTILNCYNVGNIKNGKYKAGISGRNGYDSTSTGTIDKCFYLNTSASYQTYNNGTTAVNTNIKTSDEMQLESFASTLGDEYIADGKIKDKSGEWVDNKDADGNIIYINGGYPILKWQIGE